MITMELNKETNTSTFSPPALKHVPAAPRRLLPLTEGTLSILVHCPDCVPPCPSLPDHSICSTCSSTQDHTEPEASNTELNWSQFHHPTTRTASTPVLALTAAVLADAPGSKPETSQTESGNCYSSTRSPQLPGERFIPSADLAQFV